MALQHSSLSLKHASESVLTSLPLTADAQSVQALQPCDWLGAMLQHAQLLLACGHAEEALQLAKRLQQQAATLHDHMHMAAAYRVQAATLLAMHRPADALTAFAAAQAQLAAANETGVCTAELLLEHAEAQRRVGLSKGAQELDTLALSLLRQHAAACRLAEEQAALRANAGSACVCRYVRGRTLLVSALLRSAQGSATADAALLLCQEAGGVLPLTWAPPMLHAELALAHGKAAAAQCLQLSPSADASAYTSAEPGQAMSLAGVALKELQRAADVAVTELGACCTHIAREALVAAASVLAHMAHAQDTEAKLALAFECLQAALQIAAGGDALQRKPEALELQDVKPLPAWFAAGVCSKEGARLAACKPSDQTSAAVTDVKEVAMKHFAALVAAPASVCRDGVLQRCREAQEAHAAMKAASAKYAQQCCNISVPRFAAAAAVPGEHASPAGATSALQLEAGSFAAQWVTQPTARAEASSTAAAKVTKHAVAGTLTLQHLLELPVPQHTATLTFVGGATEGHPACGGTVSVALGALRTAATEARALAGAVASAGHEQESANIKVCYTMLVAGHLHSSGMLQVQGKAFPGPFGGQDEATLL